jgi:hypothetical protein
MAVLLGLALLSTTATGGMLLLAPPAHAAPATVTFEASEPGLKVIVDGEVHTTPFQLETDDTTTHTVYAPGIQTTDEGRTMEFTSWSDGGAQEHTITPISGLTYTVNYTHRDTTPSFVNGFEEGNLSAYPQPNIDIRPGATLEVTSNHPRTGQYSAEVNTDGTGDTTTAVFDWVFPKQNTVYVTTHISLPPEFELQPGELYNAITLKNEVYARKLYLTLGSDYRLEPWFFDVNDQGTHMGAFGPVIPRDGSWHRCRCGTRSTRSTAPWSCGSTTRRSPSSTTSTPARPARTTSAWPRGVRSSRARPCRPASSTTTSVSAIPTSTPPPLASRSTRWSAG